MTTGEQFAAFAGAVAVIAFIIFVIVSHVDTTTLLEYDYKTVVEVDKSEKVESAISNAIQSVTSRDFVLTGLEITHPTFLCHKFVIKAKGRERVKILKMDD